MVMDSSIDKLFFGEIESQSKEAMAKHMAARGPHSGTIDNEIEASAASKDAGREDLKKYNLNESEEE
jgi:hypothetical protein